MSWRRTWAWCAIAMAALACGDDDNATSNRARGDAGTDGGSGGSSNTGGSGGAGGVSTGGQSASTGSGGIPTADAGGAAAEAGASGGAAGATLDASADSATTGGSAPTDASSDRVGAAGAAGADVGGGSDAGGGSGGDGAVGLDGGDSADASSDAGVAPDANEGGAPPAWNEVPVTGDELTPRRGHSAVLGPGEQVVYVFGGQGYHRLSSELFGYAWQTGVVTRLSGFGNEPLPRLNHVAVLDTARQRMLVFGGRGHYDLYNDVHALDLSAGVGAWTRLAPSGSAPAPREGHVAVFDASRNRMIVFGGRGYHDLYADVWELSFSASADGVWSPLSPAGLIPAPRTEAAAAFDAQTLRMFVGGGQGYSNVLRDMAVLDLTTVQGSWSLQSPAPIAPDNGIAGAWVWDALAQRLFQFSGQAYYQFTTTPSFVDLGAGLPGTTLTSASTQPAVFDAALVYVPPARTAVLIAGQRYHDLSGRIFAMML